MLSESGKVLPTQSTLFYREHLKYDAISGMTNTAQNSRNLGNQPGHGSHETFLGK